MVDKSDRGDRKLWAAIAWGFGLFGLILVLLTDKKSDRELKFYGVQSALLGIIPLVLSVIFGVIALVINLIPVVGYFIALLILFATVFMWFIAILLWLYGLWKAYKLDHIMFPLLGRLAEKIANKI